eukprot:6718044-Alexandrium_andersonii.AAC.1
MSASLVGSEMCIRDSPEWVIATPDFDLYCGWLENSADIEGVRWAGARWSVPAGLARTYRSGRLTAAQVEGLLQEGEL